MTQPTTWWGTTRTKKRRLLIPWPRRRQPEPEPARSTLWETAQPSAVGTIPYNPGLPKASGSLPIPPLGSPDFMSSVILDAVTEAHQLASATPLERTRRRSTAADRESTPNRAPRKGALSERLRLILAPPVNRLLPGLNSLLTWPDKLMPFQSDGALALIGSERLLLADDMGLGKTVQAIVALRTLFLRRAIGSALVVAPANILDQWRQELLKWAPDLRAIIIRGTQEERGWQWRAEVHVALVSYETLRSDCAGGPNSPPLRKTWDVLVADEAQRIKNRNATSEAVKGVKRRRSWALTGTPLENSEEELASIVEFVDHGDFVSQTRYSPGLDLRLRHRELQLRRKKTEVLQDLPPKLTRKLGISLLPRQKESYNRAEREGIIHLRELGADVRVEHVLELISRLKQICNFDPKTRQSSKSEDIRQRIELLSEQGNRALVFSQYTSADFGVEAMAETLKEFSPLCFTGALTTEERRETIRRFRSDEGHKVLIVSLRAGGLGLNLQEASYVFHLDRWWNPAMERQAEDRSHRYGQTMPVHVFKYSCIDTIEERIDQILEQKQELFDDLVDDVSIDLGASLSADQLFGLFGLERPV